MQTGPHQLLIAADMAQVITLADQIIASEQVRSE